MNHPDYRLRVIELSEETGSEDCLNCRRIAAGKLFQDLSEEERQTILDNIEEAHKEALNAYKELYEQSPESKAKGEKNDKQVAR
jgi:hypothetical protein